MEERVQSILADPVKARRAALLLFFWLSSICKIVSINGGVQNRGTSKNWMYC